MLSAVGNVNNKREAGGSQNSMKGEKIKWSAAGCIFFDASPKKQIHTKNCPHR